MQEDDYINEEDNNHNKWFALFLSVLWEYFFGPMMFLIVPLLLLFIVLFMTGHGDSIITYAEDSQYEEQQFLKENEAINDSELKGLSKRQREFADENMEKLPDKLGVGLSEYGSNMLGEFKYSTRKIPHNFNLLTNTYIDVYPTDKNSKITQQQTIFLYTWTEVRGNSSYGMFIMEADDTLVGSGNPYKTYSYTYFQEITDGYLKTYVNAEDSTTWYCMSQPIKYTNLSESFSRLMIGVDPYIGRDYSEENLYWTFHSNTESPTLGSTQEVIDCIMNTEDILLYMDRNITGIDWYQQEISPTVDNILQYMQADGLSLVDMMYTKLDFYYDDLDELPIRTEMDTVVPVDSFDFLYSDFLKMVVQSEDYM